MKTKIEWCDQTANDIVTGCSPASLGCDNCWAARRNGTRHAHLPCLVGQKKGKPAIGTRGDLVDPKTLKYNGSVALNPARLVMALKIPWNGGKDGRRIFWNSTTDTFHPLVTFEEIAAQFAVMASRPDLRFLVLTKRPERARLFFAWLTNRAMHEERCGYGSALNQCYANVTGASLVVRRNGRRQVPVGNTSDAKRWPPHNIAIGASAENQKWWDMRVDILREIPAAYKYVSVEPMLGPIVAIDEQLSWLDQVIIGAESGPSARPMKLEWAQDLGRQVLDAQVFEIECADPDLAVERGRPTKIAGPELFFKQGDICKSCTGRGRIHKTRMVDGAPMRDLERTECDACGRAGKVRKNCPEIYIPGHGTRSHTGHFWPQEADS